jgi:glycosyltransferase involved in cell wall biosynthesis
MNDRTPAADRERPLRVLHVESGMHLHGGAQQVVHLITGLHERGVENVLVCSPRSAIMGPLSGVADRIVQLPMPSDADLRLPWRIAAIARRENPHLVHLHSRKGVQWHGGLAARLGRWPVIYTRRNDTPEFRLVAGVKYRLYDRIVAISRCIEQMLLSSGVPAEKLRYVASGVDPAPFRQPADHPWLCREFGFGPSDLVVGMIAQFIPRKGHAVLLKAVRELKAEFQQLRVILLGRGKLEPKLREEIASAKLETHVHIAGFRDDLARIIPALDLVVHPALTEGLGVALIQASAAGVPIVAARAGGIPDIVRHGLNGLLVEPGDATQLAAAMGRLLRDPAERKRLGSRGPGIVEAGFSLRTMVEGNLAVYRELMSAQDRKQLKAAG